MSEALAESLERVLVPVSPGAPAGSSARYDPDFETLKTEMDKLSGGGVSEVAWEKVVALSSGILEKKSKDLLIVSYLCMALFHQSGYAGLADGLEALKRLLEDFWEGLFPEAKRMRARVSAIEWLAERCAVAIRAREPRGNEAEAVRTCVLRLHALDSVLSDKLGPEAPSLGDWQSSLRERENALPSPGSTDAGTGTTSAAATAARASSTYVAQAPALNLGTEEGREAALTSSLETLGKVAWAFFEASMQDPRAYRLARVAAWAGIRALPENAGGRTFIPSGDASEARARYLDGLVSGAEWLTLIREAEEQFTRTILWLDLQHYLVRAFDGLGRSFEKPKRAVVSEVAALLQSVPGIPGLRFDNDIAFASDATLAWIAEVVPADADSGRRAGTSAGVGEGDEQVVEEARDLARAGNLSEAIEKLEGAARASPDGRRGFLLRLALARLFSEAKEPRLAVAQMEVLDRQMEGLRLEEWERALASEVLALFLQCQRALARAEGGNAPELFKRIDEIYDRLARIDAAAALAMKP